MSATTNPETTQETEQSSEYLGTAWRGRLAGLAIGIPLFIAMLLLPPPGNLGVEAWRVAAVGLLMAVFWVTEALPLPVTAMIPLPMFPLLGEDRPGPIYTTLHHALANKMASVSEVSEGGACPNYCFDSR